MDIADAQDFSLGLLRKIYEMQGHMIAQGVCFGEGPDVAFHPISDDDDAAEAFGRVVGMGAILATP